LPKKGERNRGENPKTLFQKKKGDGGVVRLQNHAPNGERKKTYKGGGGGGTEVTGKKKT